ncbi:MAG: ABC transporter ATP-binding protein [Acidimicrobiales bacterium]
MLAASFGLRLGTLDLAADFEVAAAETVALLGPNGAGKTTVLRAVAGLQPVGDGRIALDGVTLDEPGRSTFAATASRPIGVVFQDYLLFPRLSALDNVAFGLRTRGVAKAEARREAAAWLERFGLAEHASARPRALSGGQAQRVALARALVTGPRLLLLDEPLAALDARSRVHVRAELRRHLAGFAGPRLLVTHDPVDAMVLADRVVVLEAGRVTQVGRVADVARHPRSRYVAELVGLNLLHGVTAGPHAVRLESGAELAVADPLPGAPAAAGVAVAVVVRPQAVALHRREPEGSPRNAWPATVADLEAERDRVRVQLAGPVPLVAEVTPAAVADLALEPGAPVWATVKAVDLQAYDR